MSHQPEPHYSVPSSSRMIFDGVEIPQMQNGRIVQQRMEEAEDDANQQIEMNFDQFVQQLHNYGAVDCDAAVQDDVFRFALEGISDGMYHKKLLY